MSASGDPFDGEDQHDSTQSQPINRDEGGVLSQISENLIDDNRDEGIIDPYINDEKLTKIPEDSSIEEAQQKLDDMQELLQMQTKEARNWRSEARYWRFITVLLGLISVMLAIPEMVRIGL